MEHPNEQNFVECARMLRVLVPDLVAISVKERGLRLEVFEADFAIRFGTGPPGRTRLKFFAVYRENKAAGGTWWSDWEVEVGGNPLATHATMTMAAEIRRGRRDFRRALIDQARERPVPERQFPVPPPI